MNFKKKIHGKDKNSRGHVDLCFDENGSTIATCGFDGEAKVFKTFDDDNPSIFHIGDAVHSVGLANNCLYAAGDNNSIQCYKLSDLSLDGILLRFTTHVTHLCFNKNKDVLVAGAGDFMVKSINTKTSAQTDYKGHTAPVLSVAMHPNNHFIASSSCDGTVRLWQYSTGKCTKMLSCLPKSNDVATSKTLARINFTADGKHFAVPTMDKIIFYETQKWTVSFELKPNTNVVMPFSLLSISSCGTYVAGGTADGWIFIWNMKDKKSIKRLKHDKKFTLTSLAWSASNNDIAFCDESGHVTLWKDVVELNDVISNASKKENKVKKHVLNGSEGQTVEDLFGDDDDDADLLMAGSNDDDDAGRDKLNKDDAVGDDDDDAGDGGIPGIDIDGEEEVGNNDDGGVEATGKKKTTAVIDDDDSNDWSKKLEDLPTGNAVATTTCEPIPRWEPAGLQKAFQPSSCPVGLTSRFMIWNDVGRVHQYDGNEDDGEKTINVEFHDSSIHHAIHVDNSSHNFTMAALSTEALILACEADGEVSSQVRCMNFNSWDSNKEWTATMPENEDVCGLCVGDGWLAVATDQRMLRIFTIGGVQKQIFSIPGPVVAIAGKLDLLIVVHHDGIGIPGDQCLSYKLISLLKKTNLGSGRLSLSAKSTLVWIGFSSEGSLFSIDSTGQVRMLNRGFVDTWIPVANLKEQCKGLSDNYWVVSIRENPQQIRAIFCKGSKYPPTLPLPIVQVLPFKLPLCEISSEKSNFEEQYWRTLLFSEHFKFWKVQGYEFEENDLLNMTATMKEMLMRQFALACRSKREVRAVEVCELMPDLRTIQMAIKYASQRGDKLVAEHLNDLAQMRAEEEQRELEQREMTNFPEFQAYRKPQAGRVEGLECSNSMSQEDRCITLKPAKIISMSSNSSQGRVLKCQLSNGVVKKKSSALGRSSQPPVFDESANDALHSDDEPSGEECLVEESCDELTNQASKSGSALTWKPGGGSNPTKQTISNSHTLRIFKNPFKVENSDSNSASERAAQIPRGTNIFDRMEKPSASRTSLSNSLNTSSSDASLRKRKRKDQNSQDQDDSQKETKKSKMSTQKLTGFMFSKQT